MLHPTRIACPASAQYHSLAFAQKVSSTHFYAYCVLSGTFIPVQALPSAGRDREVESLSTSQGIHIQIFYGTAHKL